MNSEHLEKGIVMMHWEIKSVDLIFLYVKISSSENDSPSIQKSKLESEKNKKSSFTDQDKFQ